MTKIVRSENAAGKNWYHLPTNRENIVVRQLTTAGLIVSSDKPLSWDVELSQSQVAQLVGKFPSVGEENHWKKLLSVLEGGKYQSKLSAEKNSILVPRTRLRSFRFAFRDWTKKLKREQAAFFASNVDCLQELWKLSVKEIEKYTYQESFHDRTEDLLRAESKALSKVKNTVDAATYFKSHYSSLAISLGNLVPSVTIQYLDREIAPLRTPNAQFVGGGAATTSGSGGMDLLLLAGNRVCAGEVKVGKDSELFEALLQAMWYGSELATQSQIERVAKCYGKNTLVKATIDIAVFSINQKPDPTREATVQLVKKINDEGKFKNLGNVYLFENNGEEWKAIS
ncbi:MAG: hypothetical protein FJ308_18350 [Planctomycetes bacterium]|nr:hypothetical protein [Planctomycetota bacterium]